ncbi:hypothetical protein [Methanospirillum sp.]
MTGQFITIPKNGFSIFIGSRDFLTGILANIGERFRSGSLLYIHNTTELPYQESLSTVHHRIEFRQERNIIDIIAMLETNPSRFVIIAYSPDWFIHNDEYIGPFGFVCRERSRRRQEVLLIAKYVDSCISELETMADKVVYVQDILTSSERCIPLMGKKTGQQPLFC